MNMKEVADRYLESRIVLLLGSVNGDLQSTVCNGIRQLDLTPTQPIDLWIDSSGGSVDSAQIIIDAIRFARSPVRGTVVGIAMSAAFAIFQACDERVTYPHAMLMFHGVRNRDMPHDHPCVETSIKFGVDYYEGLLEDLAKRSKQPIEKLREWSKVERRFIGTEAQELGFADRVLVPSPKVIPTNR